IKVDVDTVGEADPILEVGSGCAALDGTPNTMKTVSTIAVPAKMVNHTGSPYLDAKAKVSGLGDGYVVAPGSDWKGMDSVGICRNDIGGPLFRGSKPILVGVLSNFTTFDSSKLAPVTLEYTRVDSDSKISDWLKDKGVDTTQFCGDACVKHTFD